MEDMRNVYRNNRSMVLQPEIFDYIKDDSTIFEAEPLETLACEGELVSYSYDGFWQCIDTKYEKDRLEEMWREKPSTLEEMVATDIALIDEREKLQEQPKALEMGINSLWI